MNLSKSGLGYSWGFRGFRIGRDSRGRVVRTLSIPGTGLYNRQNLSSSATPEQSSGTGCGGCIGTIVAIFLALFICSNIIASGNTNGLIVVLVIAVCGYVAWQLLRGSNIHSAVDPLPYNAPVGQNGKKEIPEPNADAATATRTAAVPAEEQGQRPIIDPQFKSATGLVTIDLLKEKTKEVVESLEPLLKIRLRELKQSSNARILLEQDIFVVIVRLGLSNGSISEYAAHLYLELFKVLHPKRFAQWRVQDALDVLQSTFEENRDAYLGDPTKPFTLVALTNAVCGKAVAKPICDGLVTLLIIIGTFAASIDGKISEAKRAEIARMKTIFEALDGNQ